MREERKNRTKKTLHNQNKSSFHQRKSIFQNKNVNMIKEINKNKKYKDKIDTELSTLEAERSAIKAEQEDLKGVIKNNVDMTFKLFS